MRSLLHGYCRPGKSPRERRSPPLESACRLIAANLFPGSRAARAAHQLAGAILVVRLGGRQPQHGGVTGLHLHAVRISTFAENAVDARQVVAGYVEQQMMLKVIVDVIR